MSGCMVDGCTRAVAALGFCNTHYERFTDHGDAYYGEPLSSREPGLWSALLSRPEETRHLGHCKQPGCPRCEAAAGFVCGLLEVGA